MNIKNLESFIAVARLLNFGEAARTLNYSQSTISEQIHSLEESLGVRVFERIGRKVFLTDQGKKLLPFAEGMVREAEKIKNLFSNDKDISGSIIVGAAETLCTFWLPPILKEYSALYPNVQINIKVANCVEFPQWLQQNLIDVAFGMKDETQQPTLRQTTLFTEETVFTAATDHELANALVLRISDLTGRTLLLPEGYSGYPMDLKSRIAKENIKVNILEFGSLESIKQCVKNGLGVTFLPRIAVAEELKRGELKRLNCEGIDISIQAHMIFHRDKWLSPALAAFERLIAVKSKKSEGF